MFAKVAQHFGARNRLARNCGAADSLLAANSVIVIEKCSISLGRCPLFAARKPDCKYDTLELTPNASAKDIKDAYYKKSREFHPDLNKSSDAAKKFQAVNDAYETLSSDVLRAEYDRERGFRYPKRYGASKEQPEEMDYEDMPYRNDTSREFTRKMHSRMKKANMRTDHIDPEYERAKERVKWQKVSLNDDFLKHLNPEMRKVFEEQVREMEELRERAELNNEDATQHASSFGVPMLFFGCVIIVTIFELTSLIIDDSNGNPKYSNCKITAKDNTKSSKD